MPGAALGARQGEAAEVTSPAQVVAWAVPNLQGDLGRALPQVV